LKGPKKNTADVFVSGIPGGLDNIRSNGRGGFLVAVPFVFGKENPNLLAMLADWPVTRAIVARLLWAIRLPFELITDFYPNPVTGVIKTKVW
jgi:hypothetical protein